MPTGQVIAEAGSFRIAAALVVCEPDAICHWVAPAVEFGRFNVPAEGRDAVLVAKWDADAHEPQDLGVRVVLSPGGTWGTAEGAAPLSIPLSSPLVAGDYEVEAWLPPAAWAGPVDITIEWTLTYVA